MIENEHDEIEMQACVEIKRKILRDQQDVSEYPRCKKRRKIEDNHQEKKNSQESKNKKRKATEDAAECEKACWWKYEGREGEVGEVRSTPRRRQRFRDNLKNFKELEQPVTGSRPTETSSRNPNSDKYIKNCGTTMEILTQEHPEIKKESQKSISRVRDLRDYFRSRNNDVSSKIDDRPIQPVIAPPSPLPSKHPPQPEKSAKPPVNFPLNHQLSPKLNPLSPRLQPLQLNLH